MINGQQQGVMDITSWRKIFTSRLIATIVLIWYGDFLDRDTFVKFAISSCTIAALRELYHRVSTSPPH